MKKKVVIFISIIVILIVLFSVFLFLKNDTPKIVYTDDEIKFKSEYEKYNNADYENIKLIEVSIDSDNNIVYTDSNKIIDILTKGTNVIFIGYPTSNNSRKVVEYLINSLKNNIYYFETKDFFDLYLDEHKYESLKTILSDNLKNDVTDPLIIFVKNGNIIGIYNNDIDNYKQTIDTYIKVLSANVCSTDEKC